MGTRSAKQIIDDLAKDDRIKNACKKIGQQDWEDLYQELFLILCEMEEGKLIQIEAKGYLHFWIVRVLMNNTTSTGKFYRKYKILNVEREAEKTIAEAEDENEQVFARQREVIGTILREFEQRGREKAGWYKVNLLRLYSEKGNISEINRLTGIPFETIRLDLINFRRELATIIDKRI